MKNPRSTKAITPAIADDAKGISSDTIIGKALHTKESINAYFKGEITIQELNARGIKFISTI